VLTKRSFACLAFNRRGHDNLSVQNSGAAEGAAFQFTRERITDNVGREAAVCDHVSGWLARTLKTGQASSNDGALLRLRGKTAFQRRKSQAAAFRLAASRASTSATV
jgi:hypothetical protein